MFPELENRKARTDCTRRKTAVETKCLSHAGWELLICPGARKGIVNSGGYVSPITREWFHIVSQRQH